MLVELSILVGVILTLLFITLTSKYDYWKVRGVKYVKPHFVFGSYFDLVFFRKNRTEVHQEIYKAGEGEPYIGIIQTREPALYVMHPDIIRHVLGKDFSHFHDRGMPVDEKRNPLGGSLFTIEGARWRALRMKLTPTFTAAKIKNMLPLMEECAQEMLAVLHGNAEREEVVDMREILARFTTDVIGSCAFGVKCNSLRNPEVEFRKIGALMFSPSRMGSFFQLLFNTFPNLVKYMPMPPVMKRMTDFMLNIVRENVKLRENNQLKRNDFFELLMEIRKKGTLVGDVNELKNDALIKNPSDTKIEDFEFTENLMAAQAFVFFLAGFETSSTALSYALIELSRNTEIQDKLRDEVDDVFERNDLKWTYDALIEMKYLDKIVSETLRMYPPVPILFRKVTERYKMPDSGLVLEEGLKIYIPVHAIHHDPKIYPNPETFEPERFSDEVIQSRHNYAYLPFGEGPRNCIGQRFGILQVKLALAMLVREYELELGPQMPYPPILSDCALLLTTSHGTHIRIKKRTLTFL